MVEVVEVALLWRYSRRRSVQVGVGALVGRQAAVVVPCRPRGQVRVHGELWQAHCADGADRGDVVVVRAVDTDGLTLVVEPVRS